MSENFPVGTDPMYIPATDTHERVLSVGAGSTIYYKGDPTVTPASNDGSVLVSHQKLFRNPTWIVSGGQSRVTLSENTPYVDRTIAAGEGSSSNSQPVVALDIREFGLLDRSGNTDCLDTFNLAISYLNETAGRAITVPTGQYLLNGELNDITAGRATIFTYGAGPTKLVKAAGLTTGRFWNIEGSAASVNIGGFSYFYGGSTADGNPGPTDQACVIRFGAADKAVVGDSQVTGAAGMVEFSADSTNCTMGSIKGTIDWSLGGWMIKNLGGASVRVGTCQVNGKSDTDITDTSGATAGGGMLLIQPPTGDAADGGTYSYMYAQGPNAEGPSYGFYIDATNARAVNNQRLISPTFDHCYRYELAIVALPGSTCKMRNVQIINPRMSGDGPCSYKIDWQSTNPGQVLITDARMTFRATKRPFFFSSAPNSLVVRLRDCDLSDGSSSTIANDKRLLNFACGRWKVSDLTAGTGAGASPSYIEAGGEALPYEVRAMIVDALGGTYTLTKAGGSTTAGIAPTATAATVQTALQAAGLYGAGNVIVEGGGGGIFGPLRTRLSSTYTIGDATMHLQSIPTGVPSSGLCALSGSGNITYTGISGTDLTGCSGGTGGPYTGTPVVRFPTSDPDEDVEGNGAVYYLIFKGTYAPAATTAPGYGATAAIPALTANATNLTGSGEVGGGLKQVLIDTISHACPLDNYGVPGQWNNVDVEKTTPAAPDFIDFASYTTATNVAGSVFQQGTAAQRPTVGVRGRFYYATDGTPTLYFDNGAAWKVVGLT